MNRYLTHFESAWDGTVFPADTRETWHAGRPLWTRYDLERVRREVTRSTWENRPANMWRFRELLPVGDEIEPVTLQEDETPLIDCPRLGATLGLSNLWIKDESRLSGNSFKARGLSLAVTMARHFGARCVAMASNGNAGGSMASYAARGGLKSVVIVPRETPRANVAESLLCGARVFCANGLIDECGRVVRQGHERGLWSDISTMKEPYRLEGKKTMGLELAMQFRWRLPDVIIYPTGGGTALIAIWKAFHELRQLGWLDADKLPRMIAVQSTGCTPIVDAFNKGERVAQRFAGAATIAAGLRVPIGIGDFMVLDAVRQSGGLAVAADEDRIIEWQNLVGREEGLVICPESAVCIGALQQLIKQQLIHPSESIVVFNTAAGQKYMDHLDLTLPHLDLASPNWSAITSS